MAAICCVYAPQTLYHSRVGNLNLRCCSSARDKRETPRWLKVAVSGVTEILRIFAPGKERSNRMDYTKKDELSIYSVDDVLTILKSDYENAYFVTGDFTSAIYAEDCIFEDPTIKFTGKDLYARNLKLLVPFFDRPSIVLRKIEKGFKYESNFVLATWKLRTYLKLPWRPLISIEGNTVYDLNADFKIVRHVESWNVSALQPVGQIFTPSFGRHGE